MTVKRGETVRTALRGEDIVGSDRCFRSFLQYAHNLAAASLECEVSFNNIVVSCTGAKGASQEIKLGYDQLV